MDIARKDESAIELYQKIVDEAENVPMELPNLNNLPSWYDVRKYKRAKKYLFFNGYAMSTAGLCGFILVLRIPSVLKILILTGKSSKPSTAYTRYIKSIIKFFDFLIGTPNEDGSRANKSLLLARNLHRAASSKAKKHGIAMISQKDLVLTQFCIVGFVILRKHYLGIEGSPEDLEGYIHFWRTIGYFMGIKDEYNLCKGSIDQVTRICKIIAEKYFSPLLEEPCEDFERMASAMIVGLAPLFLFANTEGCLEFTRRMLNLKPKPLHNAKANRYVSVQVYIHTVLLRNRWLACITRPLLNLIMFTLTGWQVMVNHFWLAITNK